MGGMAAQIPIKDDERRNAAALAKVRADKEREVAAGHDGTWVAHPGLVAIAREVFDAGMPGANQIARPDAGAAVTAADLLRVPRGPITEAGARQNVSVGIQYLAAWLCGQGCVPLNDLMEDAATAEISRAQLWQWLRQRVRLDDGRPFDRALLESLVTEELAAVRTRLGEPRFASGRFHAARQLVLELVTREEFAEFLTLPAYDQLHASREERQSA
jgi:malate synthase